MTEFEATEIITPEEAIEWFKGQRVPIKQGRLDKPICNFTVNKMIDVAVIALEKQIPKKPIEKVTKDYEGYIVDDIFICPECNRTICWGIEGNFSENYPYCNCGQALDWSDTE